MSLIKSIISSIFELVTMRVCVTSLVKGFFFSKKRKEGKRVSRALRTRGNGKCVGRLAYKCIINFHI